MKVRIGVGVGPADVSADQLGAVVDGIVDLGLDSLWLSEVLTQPGPDPLAALAWAAAHNRTIKLGTTLLAPGRNLVRLAKSLATVDRLSAGRLLVTLVPGLPRGPERAAVGPPPAERGLVIDEMVPVLRRLWTGETVSHHGAAGHFDDVTVRPLPVQQPLELWLGGMAPAALDRCGRLGDGWLPALCTPADAAAGREVVDGAAAAVGRAISREHFGVSIGYADGPLDGAVRRA
ncbi:MAG: LLM class flavin-dependent oxidoreductase, partial [Acidimicrobiales bacterium]